MRRHQVVPVLCSLACAKPTTSVQPTTELEPRVVVEDEPAAEPRKLTPSDNTGEALVAVAEAITRIEICDRETGEPIATLAPETVDRLRAVLRDGKLREGLSADPAWPIILRVEVQGRREPFIVQIADVMLRIKPTDAWSPAIADASGQIDWRIRDIAMDFDLQDELAQLVPRELASDRRHAAPAEPGLLDD